MSCRPLNIGIVSDTFLHGKGGAELWTQLYVRWLLEQKHQVHVLCRASPGVSVRADYGFGFTAHTVSDNCSRWEFAVESERILKSLALDVVHDMGAGYHCDLLQPHGGSRIGAFEPVLSVYPGWQRTFKRIAARFTPRFWEYDRIMKHQYQPKRSRVFLALSKRVAADFQAFHGVPMSNVRIVYNGVDVARFSKERLAALRTATRKELGIAAHDIVLLLVAHNVKLKGLQPLLRAGRVLRERGHPVKIVVVGGDCPKQFQSAEFADILGQTIFVGLKEDTVPYYAAADCYAHPTYYDACSLVVLEALAAGLPVITTKINGASDLITDGVEGFVIDHADNTPQLVDALSNLMNSELRMRLGSSARKLAESIPLERNFSQLVSIYDEIIKQRGLQ